MLSPPGMLVFMSLAMHILPCIFTSNNATNKDQKMQYTCFICAFYHYRAPVEDDGKRSVTWVCLLINWLNELYFLAGFGSDYIHIYNLFHSFVYYLYSSTRSSVSNWWCSNSNEINWSVFVTLDHVCSAWWDSSRCLCDDFVLLPSVLVRSILACHRSSCPYGVCLGMN